MPVKNRVRTYQDAAARYSTVFEPTVFAGRINPPHLFGAVTKHRLERPIAKQLCAELRKLGADARCVIYSAHDEDDRLLVLIAASTFTAGDIL
jgi:hypothetical protein